MKPSTLLHETVILIDHDSRGVRVDTNVRRVAARLLRQGFYEETTMESSPYRRFVGQPSQISFRKVHSKVAGQKRSSNFGPKSGTLAGVSKKK